MSASETAAPPQPMNWSPPALSATPRQAAAGADIVWATVFDDAASQAFWLDPESGAAAAMSDNAVVIESSTLTPTWIAALGARLPRLVDAPVAGARARAEAEQLIFMVEGALGLIERVKPFLLLLDGAVHHLSPPGSGVRLKLVVHALFATQVGAMAELMALMRRAGLQPLNALLALRTMPVLSPAAAGTAGLMLAGNSMPRKPLST